MTAYFAKPVAGSVNAASLTNRGMFAAFPLLGGDPSNAVAHSKAGAYGNGASRTSGPWGRCYNGTGSTTYADTGSKLGGASKLWNFRHSWQFRYRTSSSSLQCIIGNVYNPSSSGFIVVYVNSNISGSATAGSIAVYYRNSAGTTYGMSISPGSTVYDGNWHTVTMNMDQNGAAGQGYFDGVSYTIGTGGVTGAATYNEADFNYYIGAYGNATPGNGLTGNVDYIYLYNRWLTQGESNPPDAFAPFRPSLVTPSAALSSVVPQLAAAEAA